MVKRTKPGLALLMLRDEQDGECVCVCVCEMKTKQEEEAANKNKTNNNRVGKRAHRNGEAFFVAKKYETKNSFFAKQHTERRGSLLCCEGHCYFIFY